MTPQPRPITRAQRARLPKARLIAFQWHKRWPFDYRTRSPFFIRWRNANAWGFLFGNLMVTIRAPWLEGPARVLHPEVFASEREALPADVRRLVIAARIVAFEDQGFGALRELDQASEAFADRVPWDNEPKGESA